MHSYLRHLANFARIVEAGSLKAASDHLGTAPSGLSDSVKILEMRYGSALLERHRGGMRPTSQGEDVYAHARTIVDALHQVFEEEPPPVAPKFVRSACQGKLPIPFYGKASPI